jgi:hypothetical protein
MSNHRDATPATKDSTLTSKADALANVCIDARFCHHLNLY